MFCLKDIIQQLQLCICRLAQKYWYWSQLVTIILRRHVRELLINLKVVSNRLWAHWSMNRFTYIQGAMPILPTIPTHLRRWKSNLKHFDFIFYLFLTSNSFSSYGMTTPTPSRYKLWKPRCILVSKSKLRTHFTTH